jgi:hypothetical protein
MADAPVVHIGENSPEEVAYKLFQHIQSVEKMSLSAEPGGNWKRADRKWILDTYAECLAAIRAPGARLRGKEPAIG